MTLTIIKKHKSNYGLSPQPGNKGNKKKNNINNIYNNYINTKTFQTLFEQPSLQPFCH